jgi:hypothetical protein
MPQDEQSQPFGGRGGELAERLKAHGFDPDLPIYEYLQVRFGITDVARALFSSTYRNPVPLLLPRDDMLEEEDWELWIRPQLAQASYISSEGDGFPGCYEEPDWYLQGLGHTADSKHRPRPVDVVRVLLLNPEADKCGGALVQMLVNTATTNAAPTASPIGASHTR